MATRTPQDDYQKTALRLPRDLHSRINEAADRSGRSMNAEIVHRLGLSFEKDEIAKESPLKPRPLPAGVEVDYRSQVWAERLLKPGNRHELENLLAVIRRVVGDAGLDDGAPDPRHEITMSEPPALTGPIVQPIVAEEPLRRLNIKGARERGERERAELAERAKAKKKE